MAWARKLIIYILLWKKQKVTSFYYIRYWQILMGKHVEARDKNYLSLILILVIVMSYELRHFMKLSTFYNHLYVCFSLFWVIHIYNSKIATWLTAFYHPSSKTNSLTPASSLPKRRKTQYSNSLSICPSPIKIRSTTLRKYCTSCRRSTWTPMTKYSIRKTGIFLCLKLGDPWARASNLLSYLDLGMFI